MAADEPNRERFRPLLTDYPRTCCPRPCPARRTSDGSKSTFPRDRSTAGRLGLRNVEYRMLDAERIDLDSDMVRTHEVPVCFAHPDLDEYLRYTSDTAGPAALVLRRLSPSQRKRITAGLEEAFALFTVADGYGLPGMALAAAATVVLMNDSLEQEIDMLQRSMSRPFRAGVRRCAARCVQKS